jgi:hypothetical protein
MTASTGAAPRITVSWGELIDKIAILEIKRERIVAKEAARNVEKELDILRGIAEPVLALNKVAALKLRLDAINRDLWDIENLLRQGELEGDFGPAFVSLARSVYKKNDERAALKRKINRILQSELVEEKSYSTFSPPTTEGGC